MLARPHHEYINDWSAIQHPIPASLWRLCDFLKETLVNDICSELEMHI